MYVPYSVDSIVSRRTPSEVLNILITEFCTTAVTFVSGDKATYPYISSCFFPFFIAEVERGGGGLENSNCETKGLSSFSVYDLIESQIIHFPSPPMLASLKQTQ